MTAPGAPGAARTRVAVYGEIDANLIDGSSVWLQSVCEMLASIAGTAVTVLLRVPERRDVITAPLHRNPRVEVVDPAHTGRTTGRLTAAEAVDGLEELDRSRAFDVVLLRGRAVIAEACTRETFAGRLWPYYIPAPAGEPELDLDRLAARSHRILCQTEPIRERLRHLPGAAGKAMLLPPMVPPAAAGEPDPPRAGALKPVLFYAGKFAPEYCFLETVALFARLRRRFPLAELHVAGDKIHAAEADAAFRQQAQAALERTAGLVWHGAVPRDEVQDLMREADIALSLRAAHLHGSLELSTKVLEYGMAGCAVLLDRTPANERLLGARYPLLADDVAHAEALLVRAGRDRELLSAAADACRQASEHYTFAAVARRIAPQLPHPAAARAPAAPRGRGRRVLIAGHDLKFIDPLPELVARAGGELRTDVWSGHRRHAKAASRRAARWADTVLCEWCLGNAVWYSRHTGRDRRLVVRLHRVELESEYPAQVDIDAVDTVVFVSRHMLDAAAERFGWPPEKLRVIPNILDTVRLRRPKRAQAKHTLAIVGYAPKRKRLDLTLDVLQAIRARDPRFRLVVKGRPPSDFPWVVRRTAEVSYFRGVYERVQEAPLLRGAVRFEPFTADIPGFLERVGWVVSTSDSEGHQVALAEGAASGAVPVVLDRPGAREQYPIDWVHATPGDAAAAVLATDDAGERERAAQRAIAHAGRWSRDALEPLWEEVLGLS